MTARIEQGGELALKPAESTKLELPVDTSVGETGAPDFGAILSSQIEDTNHLDKIASAKADALARGASDDLHGTMISLKEADISMKLVGTVRNRLLDAFHELWRINL